MKRCRCKRPIRVDHVGGYPLCDRCGERMLSDAERLAIVLHAEVKALRERVARLEAQRAEASDGRSTNGNGAGQLTLEEMLR